MLLQLLESRTLLSAGDLDTSFGSSGLVFTSVPSIPYQLQATSLAVQNDGKILAAGFGFSSTNSALFVARYLPNGSPDDSFGDHGQEIVQGPFTIGITADLKLTNGTGFVVGTGTFVLRFTESGALDNSFSGDGIAPVGHPLVSIAVQSDGSIVGLSDDGRVLHVLNTGAVDQNFGASGVANLNALDQLSFKGGAGIAIDNTNRILAVSTAYPDAQFNKSDVVVTALKSDGTLDTSFNSGKGFATADFGNDSAEAMALAPDGKIVVADISDAGQRIIRFTAAGKLDSTFNGGVAGGPQPIERGFFSIARGGLTVQSDGKIVLTSQNSFGSIPPSAGFVIQRLNSNGSLDAGFSTDGKAQISLGKPTEVATSPSGYSPAVAIADGKILLAGGTLPPGQPGMIALARLQGEGATAPLATLNSKGIIVVPGTSGNDRIEILSSESNNHTNPFVEVHIRNEVIDFPQSGNAIKGVSVMGGAGNDSIFMSGDLPATLRGGDGNDYLEANSSTNQLYGDSGNDSIHGGTGKDLIHGGSGNDLLDGSLGGDDIFGDSGTDTVNYSIRTENLTLSLDNHANDGASGEHDNLHSDIENIIGGSGNDRIIGSPFNNVLDGQGGNDTIYGGSGNDMITGGSGRDMLFGQGGNDQLFAKDGQKDSLDGGSGFDSAERDHGSVKDQVLNVEALV